MSNSLATYLHDHLAGSVHAIEILEAIRDNNNDERLGRFASGLLGEIQADRETLKEIANRVGAGSNEFKEFAAWVGDKVSRLKLRHGGDGLGTFEALELLELGIHGKWALWRALETVSAKDDRLRGIDYAHLAARAEAQRNTVEERRLDLARDVLISNGG